MLGKLPGALLEMDVVEKNLHACWFSKLGAAKVDAFFGDDRPAGTVLERAKALVDRLENDEQSRIEILVDGFSNHFHQHVFVRSTPINRQNLDALEAVDEIVDEDGIKGWKLQAGNDLARLILFVQQSMLFLPATEPRAPVSHDLPFPVLVTVKQGLLRIQILTMQIKSETWGLILSRAIERILTPVRADAIYDQVLGFLGDVEGFDAGEYIDYSTRARRLIMSNNVVTYSGTIEVGSVGSTRHDTVGQSTRQGLRESMRTEYDRLVSANRLARAELALRVTDFGLEAGTRLLLYPTIGKVVVKTNLREGDIDGFVDSHVR